MSEDYGPSGYTVKDLVYYMGFFAGIIVTYTVLGMYTDWHHLLRALLGLPVGFALAIGCERLYRKATQPGPTDDRTRDNGTPSSH